MIIYGKEHNVGDVPIDKYAAHDYYQCLDCGLVIYIHRKTGNKYISGENYREFKLYGLDIETYSCSELILMNIL